MAAFYRQKEKLGNHLYFGSSMPSGGKMSNIVSPFDVSMPSDLGSKGDMYQGARVLW